MQLLKKEERYTIGDVTELFDRGTLDGHNGQGPRHRSGGLRDRPVHRH